MEPQNSDFNPLMKLIHKKTPIIYKFSLRRLNGNNLQTIVNACLQLFLFNK